MANMTLHYCYCCCWGAEGQRFSTNHPEMVVGPSLSSSTPVVYELQYVEPVVLQGCWQTAGLPHMSRARSTLFIQSRTTFNIYTLPFKLVY